MMHYDVAFIGSGHANWHAAVALRKAGKSVVLIEKDRVGGTSTLDETTALTAHPQDLASDTDDFTWADVTAYRQHVSDTQTQQLMTLFAKYDITLIHGTGILMGKHMIQIGSQHIFAENIVLGTGQHAVLPAIMGKEYLHDGQDFLNLKQLPNHLTIIGAGVLALKFASLAQYLGTKVTILTHGARAAKNFAPRYVTKLLVRLQQAGVDIRFREPVHSVDETATGYGVTTESGLTIATDYVLATTGHEPNTQMLGLENAGIYTSDNGIVVDDHLRATSHNIYASGDAVAKTVAKTPATATFESNYIAAQILGDTAPISYPVLPNVLSACPRIARVGISAAEAAGNSDYQIAQIPYGKLTGTKGPHEVAAEMTVVLDAAHHLVGADIFGMAAPTLANALTIAITQRLSADEFADLTATCPTAIQKITAHLLPLLASATPEDVVQLEA